ncbi:transmembrane protein 254 [Protopterus annectens]|uniref:transmembrane protein 254 n=1 Tax=Protopterus annectens TaxID=7888 RepID=UPI001CFC0D3E|nr:transmembrane protein 254 [Protopterus annectens]
MSHNNYFKLVHPGWVALITLSMGYFTWVVFSPSTVPFDKFGPLGALSKYLVDNYQNANYFGYGLAWAVHALEAVYTIKLCSDKGISDKQAQMLWFGQTFLFGMASLHLLTSYKAVHFKKPE